MDNIEKVNIENIDWKSSREFFESLGEALDKLDNKDESYDFTWVGKRKSIIEAGAPISKTLRPDIEASKDFDNTKNMLIVGDNLDALKLLQESYLGKVSLAYVDPPYNTGTNMIYSNDFSDSEEAFLEESGQIDDGYALVSNPKTAGRFHSRWLSMMYPKLKLIRNLLSDTGFCVIAMDDSEIENLIKICNEVFGEENRIGIVTVVHKPEGRNQEKFFGTSNEYALFYAKNKSLANFQNVVLDPEIAKKFNLTDELGNYRLQNFIRMTDGKLAYRSVRPKFWYPIYVNKNNGELSINKPTSADEYYEVFPVTKAGVEMSWKVLPASANELIKNGSILPSIDSDGFITIQEKIRETQVIKTHWIRKEYNAIQYGTKIANDLLGAKVFDFPKSLYLIEDIVKLTSPKDESIILDVFAGSGTTSHAVMDLNAKDNATRQCISIQLDEPTAKGTEANKLGYDTIDKITLERIKRAGDRIIEENSNSNIDVGLRVFKLDSSNENSSSRKKLSDINQASILSSVDNIKNDRTPLDLLFGMIAISALPFDLSLKTKNINGNTVYLYGYMGDGTGLAACFDSDISEETIQEIARLNTLTAAFRDSSFKDSASKINLSEHFRIISPETKVKIL